METPETITQCATDNRFNEKIANFEFYEKIKTAIEEILDNNNSENWEQNESNQQ